MRTLLFSLLLHCALSDEEILPVDGDKTLQLVQIVWRHGDRSPTETCSTDTIQESSWQFGGGGWGQLSPEGMEQHLSLGTKLRARYVDTGFLSKRYSSKEVFVRSTDVNRTMISAISNMIGMYGQGSAIPGMDIPDLKGKPYTWPGAFVPIAVHTVDDDFDYILNPDMVCDRQSALWTMAQQAPEIQKLLNDNDTIDILATLKQHCNREYRLDDLWAVQDAFFIERHYNLSNPAWVTDDFFNRLTSLNDKAQDFVNGLGIASYNGVDVAKEIKRIRGGTLINSINDHMLQKISCNQNTSSDCRWMSKLKYHVYSAHDTTVYAYLCVLGAAKKVILPEGYPHYSAAIITELWTDSKNASFVKVIYHTGFEDNFEVITPKVDKCGNYTTYCPLEQFSINAQTFARGEYASPVTMCADATIIKDPKKTTGSGPTIGMFASLVFATLLNLIRTV